MSPYGQRLDCTYEFKINKRTLRIHKEVQFIYFTILLYYVKEVGTRHKVQTTKEQTYYFTEKKSKMGYIRHK